MASWLDCRMDELPDVRQFYEGLAPLYHLVYEDWEGAVERQGEALDRVLRQELGVEGGRLLDAACGIGTQALGLAARGWRVTGADVAVEALARARREARERGVELETVEADLREVGERLPGESFDAVLACDNALPHLLTDEDLRLALKQLFGLVRPGGACLVSVRDYDALLAAGALEEPSVRDYGERSLGERRFSVFQSWEPLPQPDGRRLYDVVFHFVEATAGRFRTNPAAATEKATPHSFRARYRALPTAHLLALMAEVGFADPRRLDGVFFQPLLVARRPG